MTTPRRQWTRVLAAAHLGQAAMLLTQPPAVLRRVCGERGVPPAWIGRLLGARLLIQAAPEAVATNRNLLRLGILVDLAHAASMLVAARVWPRYRRAALTSAGSASISALAGTLIVRE